MHILCHIGYMNWPRGGLCTYRGNPSPPPHPPTPFIRILECIPLGPNDQDETIRAIYVKLNKPIIPGGRYGCRGANLWNFWFFIRLPVSASLAQIKIWNIMCLLCQIEWTSNIRVRYTHRGRIPGFSPCSTNSWVMVQMTKIKPYVISILNRINMSTQGKLQPHRGNPWNIV